MWSSRNTVSNEAGSALCMEYYEGLLGWREMTWGWTKTKSIHLSCLFSYLTSSWTPFCLLFLLLECKDLEFRALSVFVSQLPRVMPGSLMSSINIYWMDEQYWKITLWTEETWQKSGKFSPGHIQIPWDFYLMFIELGIILSTYHHSLTQSSWRLSEEGIVTPTISQRKIWALATSHS